MSSPLNALHGPDVMPRTIQCPNCGVVLNVPEAAAGRRLKCPKCATKFTASGETVPTRPPSSSPSVSDYRGPSSVTLDSSSSHGDLDLPTAPGSLRETFDLPLLGEDLPSFPGGPSNADAMALLKPEGPARKRPTAAEGRSRDRRCPTCGSIVHRGMSLCNTCGLDLETGTRIDLTEDIGTMPAPLRDTGPTIGGWIVGGLSICAGVIFSIVSLIEWQKGQAGYLFLIPVCLFGVYAAVQFLRSRSVRLLIVALTIGVGVDVVALIVLPVLEALTHVEPVKINQPDADAEIAFRNPADQLDQNKLMLGIMLIVSYAAISVYLNSPGVRRKFRA
jgi:DNA-directed RNA polymerase subunit M/transcription elongation factor TFIIS